jgi:hypothetical protein
MSAIGLYWSLCTRRARLRTPVDDREDLRLGAVADGERRLPGLDAIGGEVLEPELTECGQQVRSDDRAVVNDRGGLAVEVELDVAQVLVTGVGERGAGANHARQRSRARVREDVLKPGLGGALRVVAGRRPAALGPGGTDRLLDLAAVRQAVLRAPGRASFALVPKDVARDRRHHDALAI